MQYPNELTVCTKGKVDIKPKINVSFEREISAVVKIKTSGNKVDLYVNDYRLCHKLLEFKDVEEIGFKGKLQVKSFVSKGVGREPRAGSSLRVYQAEWLSSTNRKSPFSPSAMSRPKGKSLEATVSRTGIPSTRYVPLMTIFPCSLSNTSTRLTTLLVVKKPVHTETATATHKQILLSPQHSSLLERK